MSKFTKYWTERHKGKTREELKGLLEDAQRHSRCQSHYDRITDAIESGKKVTKKQIIEALKDRHPDTNVSKTITDYLVELIESPEKNKGGRPVKLGPSDDELFRNVDIISSFRKKQHNEFSYSEAVDLVADEFCMSTKRIEGIVKGHSIDKSINFIPYLK
jgi:hypothetical protein